MSPPACVGRFAPSPTGPLHLGSLLAAAGSYLDARHAGGRWLLRIEDLDAPRIVTGAESRILATLEASGFEWDGAILRQSTRLDAYRAALEQLARDGRLFECSCSRRELADAAGGAVEGGSAYPGSCRRGPLHAGPTATRFRVPDGAVTLDDRVQGRVQFAWPALGDVVVQRRDGVIAYQLAVVVDDAWQGITDVVRGADLLDSTPWQTALGQALHAPPLRYAHLPLVVEADGRKLSKSRRAIGIDAAAAGSALWQVLELLGLAPPAALRGAPPAELWAWGIPRWSLGPLRGRRSVPAPE